jgi:hypothetical protein
MGAFRRDNPEIVTTELLIDHLILAKSSLLLRSVATIICSPTIDQRLLLGPLFLLPWGHFNPQLLPT